ncbi:MAG: sulfurtransferase complex subunit TusD [Gammaproteobacteria bacterium]
MKFTIIVNNGPYQSQSSDTAYKYADALLKEGHDLVQVFFYFEGAWHGVDAAEPPQDDRDVIKNWSMLATENDLDLIICSTAAKKRGVGTKLAPGFKIDTLGRLSEAVTISDRVITFGA